MKLFAPIRSWWNALVHRSQTDREIEAELQFHIDTHAQHLVDSGLSPQEALRQAKIEFGRVDVQKEKYRSAIGLRPLHEIGGDIRYGLRSLYRHPQVSVVAILSLALGIGATSAMFNVIYGALLHPFPYADADRIVNPAVINHQHPDVPTWFALTVPQFDSFIKAKSIDSVLGFQLAGLPETGGALPENVSVAYVTSNIGSFLGIPPLFGRGIQPSDARPGDQAKDQSNIVVLGYKYWKRRYNGDRNILGKTLDLDHQSYAIVGVMPSRFAFTQTVYNADVYIPWTPARNPGLLPWIKLKPGVSLATANAEFQSYLNKFKQETPKHFPNSFHVEVQPIVAPYVQRSGHILALLFASVLFLLLIGCANCSVLLLARGEARQHELSIRSAIGAGRFRIARQLLIESLAISFSGAALGTALSYWLARLPLLLMPNAYFPQEAAITVNLPMLAFSVGLALFCGILFGLAPAFRFSRPDVSRILQAHARVSGGSSRRSLNLLIAGQVALTFLLLGLSGAAITGFLKVTTMKLGYDPHHAMGFGVPLKRDTDKNQPKRANYVEQLRERVASVPGVVSVAVATRSIPPSLPFDGVSAPFEIMGRESEKQQETATFLVSPDYFSVLRVPLLSGRIWNQDENRRGDFVAVVNQSFVKRYLAAAEALDHQVRIPSLKDDGSPLVAASPQSGEWRQIVGVVADFRNDGLERPTVPAIYVPSTTFMFDSANFMVRTTGDPLALLRPIRLAIQSVNSEQRITTGETLEERLEVQPIWVQQRLFSILFSFFAGLALVLSLVGIASTVLFATARRRNELGIRMALGARRSHIVWTVSRATVFTIAGGIVAGLVLNLALRKLLEHWMPGSSPATWIFAPVTALLLLGTTVACILPAARAAYVDPAQTLRCD